MKKLQALVVAATLSLSGTAFADVGIVDFAKVIENSTYLKQQNQTLKQTVQPTVNKLEQLAKELESLQAKAAQAKADEVSKLEQQFKTKMTEFNSLQQQLQSSMQRGSQQMQTTFESRVTQVAEQLRVENKLDMIVERGSVLSFDKKYDLTEKVIQKVNAIR